LGVESSAGGGIARPVRLAVKRTLAKFEECLQKLETIVTQLEKGEIPLERALKLFEEGIQLSTSCRKELEEAEGKVEILLKQNGKLQPEPFDRAAEASKR